MEGTFSWSAGGGAEIHGWSRRRSNGLDMPMEPKAGSGTSPRKRRGGALVFGC